MKKKLTIMIFDTMGAPVRQASVPSMLLPMTLLLCMVAAIATYIGISDYLRLKHKAGTVQNLRSELRTQSERVAEQHNQIISFSHKISALKTKLAELQDFENKIRVIANLESKDESGNMFGVGGSDPDDLDPAIMMEQDYHEMVRDMHAEINTIDQASHSQKDSFSSIVRQLEDKRNLLAATPSIRPVKGWISSRFGYRVSPFTGRRQFHRGLDIATHSGTPIISPADGVVTFTGRKGLMGNMVTLEHGYGMVTRYGHVKKILKKKGDRVKRGETIALVGNTGRSTGPHVHYEVRLNGMAVNPTKYILN